MKRYSEQQDRIIWFEKTVKSYESAVEILTQKRKDQKKDQKAKNQIVEQYLSHLKKDHENEVKSLNEYIKILTENSNSAEATGKNSGDVSALPTLAEFTKQKKQMIHYEELKVENAKLKVKIEKFEEQAAELQK